MAPTDDPNVFTYVDASQRMKEFEITNVNFFPYHWADYSPQVLKNGSLLKWSSEYSGVCALRDQQKNIVLVFTDRMYASPVNNGKWIVFYRRAGNSLKLHLYKCDELTPLNITADELQNLSKNRQEDIIAGPEAILEEISFSEDVYEFDHEFKNEFKEIAELIVVGDISWLGNKEGHHASTALISIQPKTGKVTVYPQDWFNQGSYDFDYQWVTLGGRDPATGKLRGTGIRLANFECDETGRQLEKGGKTVFF
jgi:hypothetical protein